jgi:uncharacterized caspase-like protein
VLYVNDTIFAPGVPIKNGTVETDITIEHSRLAHGENEVRLVCVNGRGIENEAAKQFEYDDGAVVSRKLYAVCVGINDYTRVKNFLSAGEPRTKLNLNCAVNDAEEVTRILRQHTKSNLFTQSEVENIPEQLATAAHILARIEALGKQAGPDDVFVLFLSGHGEAEPLGEGRYKRGSFFYLCRDSDRDDPRTQLRAEQLHNALRKIAARKLVLIDTCRSGAVGSNPGDDISRDARFMILSACKAHQVAQEPPRGERVEHGFFTQGLLAALKPSSEGAGKPREQAVTARELGRTVKTRIAELVRQYERRGASAQIPEYFPKDPLPGVKVLCRP